MAGFIGGRPSAFDYIQPGTPGNPKVAEQWLDTDDDAAKIYLGAAGWLTVAGQDDLDSVSSELSSHSSSTGGVHGVPSDDNVAGQADVDAVTSALSDHEGDTTNPHNVTDDQTGAASALSDHEGDTTNPHNVTDDQTGAAAALSSHESDTSNPHSTVLNSYSPGYFNPVGGSGNTVYSNNSDRLLYVSVETGGSSGTIRIDSSNASSLGAMEPVAWSNGERVGALIPPGWNYGWDGGSINGWLEMEVGTK